MTYDTYLSGNPQMVGCCCFCSQLGASGANKGDGRGVDIRLVGSERSVGPGRWCMAI